MSAQTTPWNIPQVNATPAIWTITTAGNVKVGVLDTGINLTHPDLQANIFTGFNTINTRKSPNDDNGHGTHVAGIIAALNNTTGVVGVAPKAHLYPIKVLNAAGSGTLMDLIEGLNWAIDHQLNVINMSLGFDPSVTAEQLEPLGDTITKVHNAGITIVAASGNASGAMTGYPARYPEVLSIVATDRYNTLASFNSVGKVEFAAPGVSIYSTYKKSYATLSGTSMATPHVTGIAALIISQLKYDLDKDNAVGPEEVKLALIASAQDLGPTGFDNLSGYGLARVPAP